MHAVEAAHHIAVHHVDHRFGHGVVHALVGQHAFLHDDLADFLAVLDDGSSCFGAAAARPGP
jgi:hypothetical protein